MFDLLFGFFNHPAFLQHPDPCDFITIVCEGREPGGEEATVCVLQLPVGPHRLLPLRLRRLQLRAPVRVPEGDEEHASAGERRLHSALHVTPATPSSGSGRRGSRSKQKLWAESVNYEKG